MKKTAFVSLITENDVVRRVVGNIYEPPRGIWGAFSDTPILINRNTTDAMNICSDHGYEHMATEMIGTKVVHRMKLRS